MNSLRLTSIVRTRFFFFSSRSRHTRYWRDWSSDVCSSDLGIDLIVIYNSGRYRMAERGSLAGLMPYGDANAIVMEMAGEVLPVVRDTPVLAGGGGNDPVRLMPNFPREGQERKSGV